MATAQEKEALGLSADASEEEVAAKIAELTAAAANPSGSTDAPDLDAVREQAAEQARAEAQADADAKIADLQAKVDELNGQLAAASADPGPEAPAASVDRSTSQAEGTEVTIKIRAFPYYEDHEDPVTGQTVRREQVAVRGATVRLSGVDLARAKQFDAILTDADKELQTETAGALNSFDDASVEDLARWLRGEYPAQESKPTVDEVVEATDEDYAIANRMIQAENLATGGQPRSTLVERLQDIADANTPA